MFLWKNKQNYLLSPNTLLICSSGHYSKHCIVAFRNKEFLPKEYCKIRGIEKKIFAEHKKWAGYSERDAKVKYTQQCRALKTYGITFFLVKVCFSPFEFENSLRDTINRYSCEICTKSATGSNLCLPLTLKVGKHVSLMSFIMQSTKITAS